MAYSPDPQISGLLSRSLQFSHMFDEIPLGVLVLDLHRRVVYFNRSFEALTGFSLARAHGIPCHHVLRSRACITGCPVSAMNSDTANPPVRERISRESDIVNVDRQRIPVRMTTAAIRDIHGDVTGYIETVEDLRAVQKLEKINKTAYSFENIIGRSPQMEKIFQILPVLAQSDASILVTGKTGTGKDLVAEAIHNTSERASGPFIKINCGALPETLLESEIFGHQKGAFTGAVENKQGRFRLAHNGTIFLTEIGDLPLSLQVKLLTFLDDKTIYPLGSTKGFKVDVRMVAATHRNLKEMVRRGQFRQDLYFRLNVAIIHLPALKKREGDIRLLIDHFLNSHARQLNRKISGFSREALGFLLGYRYEGNIRELKNIVEYAVNIASDSRIELEHLPAYLFEQPAAFDEVVSEQETPAVPPPPLASPYAGRATTWASAEREMILDALLRAKGKKKQAAARLGWSRSTLWRKLKQYGIEE